MIKVVTSFSGVGCPEMALTEMGIQHRVICAGDIDKYAKLSYNAIHSPEFWHDDFTSLDYSSIEKADLAVFGFPCQAFSLAGKRKGFDDVRGTLFFNVAEFMRLNQPDIVVLENVKGLLSHDKGRTFQTIVDLLSNCGGSVNGQTALDVFEDGLGYHIYHQVLNTKDFGIPQNRERIFIVCFKNPRDFNFPKPFPLEKRLKDVLEENVDDKYYLSDEAIIRLTNNDEGYHSEVREEESIASTVCASDYKIARGMNILKVKSATSKGYEIATDEDSINFSVPNSETRRGRVGKGVEQTLDTQCNQGVITYEYPRVKYKLIGGKWDNTHEQNGRVYDENGIAPTIQTMGGGNQEPKTFNNYKIRRLTPLECWRLQGFSDNDFYKAQKVCSDTQLYKQAGNSMSKNVIIKLFEKILKNPF